MSAPANPSHVPAQGLARRRGRRQLATVSAIAVVLAGLLPAIAAGPAAGTVAGAAARGDGASAKDLRTEWGNYDARSDHAAKQQLATRSAQLRTHPAAGVKALRKQLGTQGIVDIDPLTSTPRQVGRLDGFLTGPSAASPRSIVLRYIRAHPEVFGLSDTDFKRLTLRKDYVDIAGTHHVSFIQTIGGVPLFGNGIKAHVTKNGRLISVQGSPVAGLPTAAAKPGLTAAKARQHAVSNVGRSARPTSAKAATGMRLTTTFGTGDRAEPVYFQTVSGPRLAWQTLTAPTSDELYQHVIDAATGRTLYRAQPGQRRQRSGLGQLPGRTTRWPTGASSHLRPAEQLADPGRQRGARLQRRQRRQRGARLQRRQRRQRSAAVRGDHSDRQPTVRLPVPELQQPRRAVLGCLPVLMEPGRAELVAGQPGPELGPGGLLPG